MDSDHVLVVFFALVLVGAAVALAYSAPAFLGDGAGGVGDASLASFETSQPYCGDPNTTSGSAFSRDIAGGQALVINDTVPVASNDTRVSATLEEFGPERYILQVTRETPERTATPTPTATPTETATATATPTATPVPNATRTPNATETATTATRTDGPGATGGDPTANETANATNGTATERAVTTTERATATPTPGATTGEECFLEVGYNATIHVAQPTDYTLLITYDGELVGAHWREGEDDGSFDRVPSVPRTDETGNGSERLRTVQARSTGSPRSALSESASMVRTFPSVSARSTSGSRPASTASAKPSTSRR